MLRLLTILTLSFWLAPGYAQVVADFDSDTTAGCTPVTVNFTSKSTGSIISYRWDFGNGNKSTKQNPSAIFYKPGFYKVSLEVSDGTTTDTKTVDKYIQVYELPKAEFDALKKEGCAPLSVPFSDKSSQGSGKIQQVTWDFGDGNTSSISAFHTYKYPGQYNVSLLVIDEFKCEAKLKKDKLIDVWEVPIVDFSVDNNFSCTPPLKVQFTSSISNASSGDTYLWTFGDGSTSTSANPSHTYQANGTYTVSLKVTNSKGCSSTKSYGGMVAVSPIKPDFSVSKTEGCAPLEVHFTNKTSPNVSGLIYNWDLGNGDKPQTPNVQTTYSKPGTYNVSLKVSKGSCTQTELRNFLITVKPSPEPKLKISDSTTCKLPYDIVVDDAGTGSNSWKWALDGTPTLQTQKGTIKITTYGTRKVSLVTHNTYGCPSDTLTATVVAKPIEVSATKDTMGCKPLTVTFTNTSPLPKSTMRYQYWDFGDGTTKEITDTNQLSVTHTFKEIGEYTVKLLVRNHLACENEAEVTVEVGKKFPPQIEKGLDTLCNSSFGEVLNLSPSNYKDTLDLIIWKLLPKTGRTGSEDKITKDRFGSQWDYRFPVKDKDSGYYDVQLITMHNGCYDTITIENRIYIAPPRAKLVPLHDTCANDIIILVDSSQYEDSIVWRANDYYTNDSIVRFGTDSVYHVVLYAFNSNSGCIDSVDFIFQPKLTFKEGFNRAGDLCAPTSLTLVGRAPETYLLYRYVVDEKDTFYQRFLTLDYDNPGTHTIEYLVLDTSATGGCAKMSYDTFTVTGPIVNGTMSGTPGCGPIDIKLTCNSDPSDFARLFWTVGPDTLPVYKKGSITHELFKPGPSNGKWPITLVGVDSNGCIGTKSFEIVVYGTKGAELYITRFKDCSGRKFKFSPIFSSPVKDSAWIYEWDVGDGSSRTKTKVLNYTYKSEGKYAVKLFITDQNGCVTRVQDTIDIQKETVRAKFFADSLIKQCPPLHVEFEDRSSVTNRQIVKWEWSFGDGTTSFEQYPSKLYLTPGRFDVSLKVTDEWGCVDSINYPDFILVNGPTGRFTFDNTEGCVPLDVTFEVDTAQCNTFTWDFGDGNILKDVLKTTHTYQDTGRFIPLVTLSDSFGCTYTHPPIDTIYVYPLPYPNFNFEKPCPGTPTAFFNNSEPYGKITSCQWDFGDGQTSTNCYPNHTFKDGGTYQVKLTVETKHGCKNDTIKPVQVKAVLAGFTTKQKDVCVGSTIDIKDISQSDTSIVRWFWLFNDKDSFDGRSPSFLFDKVGPVKVQLIIEDALGCLDTLISTTNLKVGDTIPPEPVPILRVSVEDDYSYLMDYNRAPIGDFKSYLIYADGLLVDEIFDQDSLRHYFKGNNTLQNVYCSNVAVKNTCGYISGLVSDSVDCTVEVSGIGELNQSRIWWNAYHGWNEVETYYIYRETSTGGHYALLDSVGGNVFEYVDTNVLCYQEHRYRILASEKNGNKQVSWSDTCETHPIYVNSLPPNELVRATVEDDKFARIEWLPVPYSKMPIDHYILEKSFNEKDFIVLNGHIDTSVLYMEDMLVEVDSQSYTYRVRAVDVCDDASPYSNLGKTILLKASKDDDHRPLLNWSHYQGWRQGVSKYEVEIKNPDGSFSSIGFTGSGMDTTLRDEITQLNQRPHYCYRVIGYRSMGPKDSIQVISVSNEDCINVQSWLFVPNAFSPNGDNLNDKFVTPGWYIKDYNIRIYTRWGEQIFESNSIYDSWDGTYNGVLVESEAYLYIIESIGVDNVKRKYKGTVTVVK